LTIIYLSIYIIILLLVWWLYIVARMHSMKFKNFSTHIVPVTNWLMIFLAILSITGFIVIFSIPSKNSAYEVDTSVEYDKVKEVEEKKVTEVEENYQEEIIWEEYY